MIPRKRLDIAWSDLLAASMYCVLPGDHEAETRLETIWSLDTHNLVSLSVRSGFYALLQALQLPAGGEILVSAVTIRDMTRIIEHHGLVPIPVDIDTDTLSVNVESMERAVTEKTRAVLVAHLFGSRMPLDPVIDVAKRHGLYVFEDCAQAYVGPSFRGHPESDVTMFSFGPIKTKTALGGAILGFKDRDLYNNVKAIQDHYPRQRRSQFLRRLVKFALLKALGATGPFNIFVTLCRLLGISHDRVISEAVRGFADGEFYAKIRQRPSFPLLALLERRLQTFDPATIDARINIAQAAIEQLASVRRPGERASHHNHWVFPILASSPEDLMKHLWRAGFDATRHGSSLYVVDPPHDRPEQFPVVAAQAMQHMLYLPVYAGIAPRQLQRLGQAISNVYATQPNVSDHMSTTH